MTPQLFNRTILLWAGAIAISLFIVNPRAARVQRINAMNGAYIDCVVGGNCKNTKAIYETREYYAILAELYPDYGRGPEMEGMCDLLLKQDNLAIKKFQEAIKHNPDLFWVYFELGKAFYRRGDYAQALKYFQDIIQQDNNTLLRKAALSNLRQFPDKARRELMLELVDFVTEIKSRSYHMAVGCLAHQNSSWGKDAYSAPFFHPWGHVIQPLKEILYQ
jgi:tetratricopeptide (TPR) repeat protein